MTITEYLAWRPTVLQCRSSSQSVQLTARALSRERRKGDLVLSRTQHAPLVGLQRCSAAFSSAKLNWDEIFRCPFVNPSPKVGIACDGGRESLDSGNEPLSERKRIQIYVEKWRVETLQWHPTSPIRKPIV